MPSNLDQIFQIIYHSVPSHTFHFVSVSSVSGIGSDFKREKTWAVSWWSVSASDVMQYRDYSSNLKKLT